jgi:hypothetical protein
MARERAEDLMWYVCTRKDSGSHYVLNENYIEKYEREFIQIREYDTIEEAVAAHKIREDGDIRIAPKSKKKITAGKVRGNIRRGDAPEDNAKERMRAEIMAEMDLVRAPSEEARAPAKKRATNTKPSKEILE